ncbi:MAG: hypothetical protein ABL897_11210 [Hyphomicrobium sp.]
MTLVSNPNGLLIASTLFALSGLAVLARAFWASLAATQSDAEKKQRKSEALVASWFGFPLVGLGAFLNGAGQFASGPIGAGLTCLLLALAFALLLFAALEGTLTDIFNEKTSVASEQARRPLLAPPKLIAVEVHDAAADVTETARQALPA